MYKVFINEKKITISKSLTPADKNIPFEGLESIEAALALVQQPALTEVNLYGEDLAEIWEEFTSSLKVIEAAGGIVLNNKGEILFIHRLGKWDLPKGKVEPEEHLRDAAVREVQEETGLMELEIEDFTTTTFHIYLDEQQQKILKTTYWFSMHYGGNAIPVPQQEEGISEVKWMGEELLKSEVYPNTFANIKIVLEEILAEKKS